jgi:hypothetical protein
MTKYLTEFGTVSSEYLSNSNMQQLFANGNKFYRNAGAIAGRVNINDVKNYKNKAQFGGFDFFDLLGDTGKVIVKGFSDLGNNTVAIGDSVPSLFSDSVKSISNGLSNSQRQLVEGFKREAGELVDTAKIAVKFISFLPGIGTAFSAVLVGAMALVTGQPIDQVFIQAAGAAVPGGIVANASFKLGRQASSGKGVNVAESLAVMGAGNIPVATLNAFEVLNKTLGGTNVPPEIVNAAITALPPEMSNAYIAGASIGTAEKLQQQVLTNILNLTESKINSIADSGATFMKTTPSFVEGYNSITDLNQKFGFKYGMGVMALSDQNEQTIQAFKSKLINEPQKIGFDLALSARIGSTTKATPELLKAIQSVKDIFTMIVYHNSLKVGTATAPVSTVTVVPAPIPKLTGVALMNSEMEKLKVSHPELFRNDGTTAYSLTERLSLVKQGKDIVANNSDYLNAVHTLTTNNAINGFYIAVAIIQNGSSLVEAKIKLPTTANYQGFDLAINTKDKIDAKLAQGQIEANKLFDAINVKTSDILKKGSTGDRVKEWQKVVGVTPDGIFGPNTESATKIWQTNHNLTADGIVGANTLLARTKEEASLKEFGYYATEGMAGSPTRVQQMTTVASNPDMRAGAVIGIQTVAERRTGIWQYILDTYSKIKGYFGFGSPVVKEFQ